MPVQLTIVTPEGESFSGSVETVVLPGSEGDFGVLEHHERFLAPLRIGAVSIGRAEGAVWAAVSEGFAEVDGERVVVLVDSCELAEDIDAAEARDGGGRIRNALQDLGGGGEDERRRAELEAELELAELKVAIAGRS